MDDARRTRPIELADPSRKLIVLRGNSASGRSTVARRVRESAQRKVAVVGQDYIRRTLLKEKDTTGYDTVGALIQQIVDFSLDRGYAVIVEGILSFEFYEAFLRELVDGVPDHYLYYLDVSFAETLRRHATKSNAQEYGEDLMRDWYQPGDVTSFDRERIIPEHYSLEQTVSTIIRDAGL